MRNRGIERKKRDADDQRIRLRGAGDRARGTLRTAKERLL